MAVTGGEAAQGDIQTATTRHPARPVMSFETRQSSTKRKSNESTAQHTMTTTTTHTANDQRQSHPPHPPPPPPHPIRHLLRRQQ